MEIYENSQINEKIYLHRLPNGLDILVIPKKGFMQKTVMFGTKFGSINNRFVIDGQRVDVPDGIAHFLEHKVFEQKSGEDALMTLCALGANPNAYTTSDHTVYYFDTNENFEECMKILFDFVQNPYFTDENVKKEQGIIGQEIQMYDDHEDFQLYINLLQNMYATHPIRIDTAGTIKSISKINKELLYKCYYTFYSISNMLVCVCGDVEPEKIIKMISKLVPEKVEKKNVKEFFPVEPNEIYNKKSVKQMSISTPLFAIGFKDNGVGGRTKEQKIIYDIAAQIALKLLIGKSSNLYKRLYEKNLLIGEVGSSYTYERDYGHIIIEGLSAEPEKVIQEVENEIKYYLINEEEFIRVKKMLEGEYILEFNNVSQIARNVFVDYIKGINTLDYFSMYKNIKIEDVQKMFNELINEKNMALSIIEKGK